MKFSAREKSGYYGWLTTRGRATAAIILLAWLPGSASPQQRLDFDRARRLLVERDIRTAGVSDPRVLKVMAETPRHEFVPVKQRPLAYYDMSLPIGDQQTISSPFIVAYMTQALEPRPTDRILEIGTGSGYQAAILSPLVEDVFTIEIVETLGRRAERTLRRLRYQNVRVRVGDGFQGWPEEAPFDKIIVTCSPEDVPPALAEQLKEGGRMVIPVGERYQQTLYVLTKENGELRREPLRPTLFVPMTGQAEAERELQPDPANPKIHNGDFERAGEGDLPLDAWYYQRQVQRSKMEDTRDQSTEGTTNHVAHFANQVPGRSSSLLQGFALDGRSVSTLELQAKIRLVGVKKGPGDIMKPAIAISFYDENRASLGELWAGPWLGTREWQSVSKRFSVPEKRAEAILRIGLFGATGELFVDDVAIWRFSTN